MKNELLMASILVLNPVTGMSNTELSQVVRESIIKKENLVSMIFKSSKTSIGTFWTWNPETRTSQSYEKEYHIEARFIKVIKVVDTDDQNYEYNGDELIEYELIVERVSLDGKSRQATDDYFYFVRQLSDRKYKIYDCDSSARCYEDYSKNAEFYIFDTPRGKILKLKKSTFEERDNFFEFDELYFDK
jgi:hypothetical protein